MQRLVGPILHLKQGDSQTWRFTVSVWARIRRAYTGNELSPIATITLTTPPPRIETIASSKMS